MRVCIRLNSGRSFRIPVPIWLVRVGLNDYVKRSIIRYAPEKDRRYIEGIDFNELMKSIEMLKEYKGLKLIEVRDSDGTEIEIIV